MHTKRQISIFAILLLFITSTINSQNFLIVSKEKGAKYNSIQSALNEIKDDNLVTFIYVKNGIYNEKLYIEKNNIVLIGESREGTKIEYAELRRNWVAAHNTDYGSSVININKDLENITLINLSVNNNYGNANRDHDHAFTIRSFENTTKIILDNCSIVSEGGDALSLWSFNDGMFYHNNCFFEGYVDFVCPRGYCYIENSTFFGHNLTAAIWHDGNYDEKLKFVLRNCRFDGVVGFPLGRFHWDAQFYLIDCTFSKNMKDKKIFFAPSKPPRTLKWGEDRIYFFNCKKDNEQYEWFKNNLVSVKPEDISPEWTFNNRWNPRDELKKIYFQFNHLKK